jgi:benzoylformate decarboxylase
VRDAVLDLLRRFGMTSVFGNPGSTELPLFRDFPADFRYVLGLQEAVVVGMADGHAQATRNAAFVNLHSAAGVGHAMGNIFTAHKNRTPLVITAGQQARSILPFDPFLFSNQATELPKPYVKWSCEPARAEDVPLAIARAYYIAMQEPRGPVFVSVPADDWDQPASLVVERVVSTQARPDPAVLEPIGAALNASQAPGLRDRCCGRPQRCVGTKRCNSPSATTPACSSRRCRADAASRKTTACSPASCRRCARRSCRPSPATTSCFAIGAPAFTYHVEGTGPAPAAGRRAVPADRGPGHRRVGARGHGGGGQHPPRPARSARAAGTARAPAAANRAARCRAQNRRGTASACRLPTCCRRWPSCAMPRASWSKRRRARAR